MTLLKERINTNDMDFVVPGEKQYIDRELGITVCELGDGRRKFEMDLGRLGKVEVLDIRGSSMTDDKWDEIEAARESYALVWGGNGTIQKIKEDPFDGRDPFDREYVANQHIATFTAPNGDERIITHRKVVINPEADSLPQLFDDVAFWNILDGKTGETHTLQERLREYM